ncbi:ArsC/Spx/MgsR family protein [uncultured Sphaerochaeta sp.]|uniref:arsenate reductase family protein n=1 Tax=uncultured Sphaerochaeta sp. TaxID=886478 RepID=UPI002A0A4CD2|nr:ArsC/Spx/MgsR family protein [uncultured Sphaerochaeta sp.]
MLQIIGTKKCKDTAKVLRACKERSIPFQFVDLSQRDLSEGEWKALFAALPAQELLDTDSVYYIKNGYSFREFDSIEELKEHPQLLKTPILRNKGKVSVGYSIDSLLAWGNT